MNLCSEYGVAFRDRLDSGEIETEFALAVSWRWMIPTSARLIVLHDSLLPRYRGFSPLVTALIKGDETIGVTALFASGEYDKGAIILQKSTTIAYPIKIQLAIEICSQLSVKAVSEISHTIFSGGHLPTQEQDEKRASYSLWRDEADYQINWFGSADQIRRFIDSVGYPYLGASTTLNGKSVRVFDATTEPDVRTEDRTPGKVLFVRDGLPIVVCGSGLLKLTDLRSLDDRSLLPLNRFRSRFS